MRFHRCSSPTSSRRTNACSGPPAPVWMCGRCSARQWPATCRRSRPCYSAIPRSCACQYAYRTPLYFAVRENGLDAASFLLDRGTDPIGLPINDRLVDIARDRGFAEMQKLLESKLARIHNASTAGEPVAAAIRPRDLAGVCGLLDAEPELLHTGDERSNQPIHWAVMTRQIDMIDELLSRGADINAQRFDGARPIQLTSGDYHFRGWRDVPDGVAASPEEVLAHLRPAVPTTTSARPGASEIWTVCESCSIKIERLPTASIGTSRTTKDLARL